MKTIISFLKSHPLIPIMSLEKAANMPLYTLKLDGSRNIPNKHIPKIKKILSNYGYNHNNNIVQDSEHIAIQQNNKQPLENITEYYLKPYTVREHGSMKLIECHKLLLNKNGIKRQIEQHEIPKMVYSKL